MRICKGRTRHTHVRAQYDAPDERPCGGRPSRKNGNKKIKHASYRHPSTFFMCERAPYAPHFLFVSLSRRRIILALFAQPDVKSQVGIEPRAKIAPRNRCKKKTLIVCLYNQTIREKIQGLGIEMKCVWVRAARAAHRKKGNRQTHAKVTNP